MECVIQVSGLAKSYSGKQIIEEIDISVLKGEVYGLLGPNGAGKSTTVECMLGTRKADRGTVTILGLDPVRDRKKLFEHVGVQFQDANYADKIRVEELCEETACLYSDYADYESLLQSFDLQDKKTTFISELSGGQRQRLFIILALIPNPEVVFLDELTSGLDVKARRSVWKSLLKLKQQGMTIFLTSHFMDEVEMLCDRIGVLKGGRMAYTGTVKEFVGLSPYDKLEDAYLWFTGEEEADEK
ncbi:ATP-binding cassette domain-containing protein [Clostridium sp. MCC353]|uniref:ABC transporter ATP-binding protein n=1 Tax=Clostridium sp. MCC353 TaxID=2592646 RepID=UPI001C02EA58|nr:ABC transporter ATP-binding protein [Clostridium sp. MCC353]MBT9775414.1 ATP-binding cassette domain-containing protein [Clostridium sp. MCC353]